MTTAKVQTAVGVMVRSSQKVGETRVDIDQAEPLVGAERASEVGKCCAGASERRRRAQVVVIRRVQQVQQSQ